ncbi:SMR domain-containing protein At5g58720 isoform X2 [Vicia villosa]|uniref:SMR domain-containing protein At5g58720 isoform X2 n=1 Tax=Vicia villosa TaxID=3911 RepID=UPI00273C4A8D|nr:SMR domain-containing protein At5g58720 isoform X2 [Vicia villosa]
MKNSRKKKKQKPPKNVESNKEPSKGEVEKNRVLQSLVEAFSLSSIEEAVVAYDVANGDSNKASEILRRGLVDSIEDPYFCSSSSSWSGGSSSNGVSSGLDLGSTSGSSDGFLEQICREDVVGFEGVKQKQKQKQKRIVAATGTVSTILGNEYVRRNSGRKKRIGNEVVDKDEAEQFLYSMLGNDCDLNLAVVRDVLCQCGYDVEKASDILLDLAANERSSNDRNSNFKVGNNMNYARFPVDYDNDSMIDRRSECTSLSSEGDFSDNIWGPTSYGRNYAEVLTSSKANSHISPGCTKFELPQKVLESLFNIPKSSEHDKGTMNWRNIAKKMQSLGPGFGTCPNVAEPQQRAHTKGEEYHAFREGARQQWDSVKCYFQKAATAYSNGERGYAAYLSDQGKEQTKVAQKADTKASHDIFVARNKGIENVITIDLHGQHVKPAMRMLKLHLLFGSYVPSVQMIRVITGCGSHGFGKSKLKQSVTKLLDKESIEWSEENRGTVLIKLNGWREFSFLDTDSDSDSD